MLGTLLTKVFGSKHEREAKRLGPVVEEINRVAARRTPTCRTRSCAAKTDEFRARLADGETARRPAARGLRRGQGGLPPPASAGPGRWSGIDDTLGHGALRRPAHRRHRAAPGQDRRDGHRRGQDAGRHHAALPQRARRARAPTWSRSTTTWPAATASGWARSSSFLGLTVGCIQHEHGPRRAPRAAYGCDITYGTNNEFGFDYLRDNMAVAPRAPRAARLPLRHRRRGRLGADRRGAHAAHHLGPGRAHATRQFDAAASRWSSAWSGAAELAWCNRCSSEAEKLLADPSKESRRPASRCCRSSAARPRTSAS